MQDTRAIYLESCAAIAAAFAPLGYKFAKSGPRLAAKSHDGRFTYRIGFQTSHLNAAGLHVALLVHASIASPAVKQWEAALWARYGQSYGGDGGIGGAQLGYLAPPTERGGWLEWELAKEHVRAEAIADVTDRITRHALPWFAHCEDVPLLIEHIAQTGVYPGPQRGDAPARFPAEFMLCFAGKEQTARALAAYVQALKPGARGNFYKDLAAARAEAPLQINYSGSFSACAIRYLLAEGIAFPDG